MVQERGQWWATATTEAKQAQIRGGKFLGMTGKQIALASGLGGKEEDENKVLAFTREHLPTVTLADEPKQSKSIRSRSARGGVVKAAKEFIAGERPDWMNKREAEPFLEKRDDD